MLAVEAVTQGKARATALKSKVKHAIDRGPNFQDLLLQLEKFWADRDCVLQQPYDVEVGAGTDQVHQLRSPDRLCLCSGRERRFPSQDTGRFREEQYTCRLRYLL
ncbi:MAG: glycine--tRNA ligase subunit alpha [Acidobacteriaceae bacterium]